MDAGNLVPDSVTNEMLKDRLSQPDAANGFLLDGYPRNVGQAEFLAEVLKEKSLSLDSVLELSIPMKRSLNDFLVVELAAIVEQAHM